MKRWAIAAALALALPRCAPATERAVSEVRPTPDAGALPPSFDPAERVERYAPEGATVVVHFTRDGRNAVPATDADGDGWPDYVALVSETYQRVLAFEASAMRFRSPLSDATLADNGGDGRFDVYLVDFNGRGDGAFRSDACEPAAPWRCRGHMLQDNDFNGYGYPSLAVAVRTVASHELFHSTQAAYRSADSATLAEGTAVWATERFDPSLDDLERLSAPYLSATDRSLDVEPSGPADSFSYGVSLWFLHQGQRHGDSIVEALLARRDRADAPSWLVDYRDVLRARDRSFVDEFNHFASWCLFTATLSDPARGPAQGAQLRTVPRTALALGRHTSVLRLFRSSFRVFAIDAPPALTSLVVAVDPASNTANTALLVAPIRGGRIDSVTQQPLASQTLDTHNAERLLLVAVNANAEGPSAILTLCAQDHGRRECEPPTAAPDAGADAAGAPPPQPAPPAGCAATPARTSNAARALLLLAALYSALVARRFR
jgi:hypothetical protein